MRLNKGKRQKVAHLLPASVFEEIDDALAGRLRKPDDPRYHDDFFLLCVDEAGQPLAQLYERLEPVEDHLDATDLRTSALDLREAMLAQAEARMVAEGGDAWGILWTLSLDHVGNARMAEMEESAIKWLHQQAEWYEEKHIRPFSQHAKELYGYMDTLAEIGVIEIRHDWGYWYSASRLGRSLLARTDLHERVEAWKREAERRTRRWRAMEREWDDRLTQNLAGQHPDGWRLGVASVHDEDHAIVARPDGTLELNDSSNGFSDEVLAQGKSVGELIRAQLAGHATWIDAHVKAEKAPVAVRRRQHYPGQPTTASEPTPLRADISFVQPPPEIAASPILVEHAGSVRGGSRSSQWEETYFTPLEGEPREGEWIVRRELRHWSTHPATHSIAWTLCPPHEVPEDVRAPREGRPPDPTRCVMLDPLGLRKLAAGAAQVRSLQEGDVMGILPKKGTNIEEYRKGEIVQVKSSSSLALGQVVGTELPDEAAATRLRVQGLPRSVDSGPPRHAGFGEEPQ